MTTAVDFYITYLSVLGVLGLFQIIWLLFEIRRDKTLTQKTDNLLVQTDGLPIQSWKNWFDPEGIENRHLENNHPCRVHNTNRIRKVYHEHRNPCDEFLFQARQNAAARRSTTR